MVKYKSLAYCQVLKRCYDNMILNINNLHGMKKKTLADGNTKVWFEREEEFKIISKSEPLIDTLIEANLLEKRYSQTLVEEIQSQGHDDIHGVLLHIDEILQDQMDNMKISELDLILSEFNSTFSTSFKYYKNSNGLISITFGQFDNYQEFRNNYFCSFILKLFAFKIDIMRTEKLNPELKGISEFLTIYAGEQMNIYLEASRTLEFARVIRKK